MKNGPIPGKTDLGKRQGKVICQVKFAHPLGMNSMKAFQFCFFFVLKAFWMLAFVNCYFHFWCFPSISLKTFDEINSFEKLEILKYSCRFLNNSRSEQFWKQNTNHLFFAGTKYFFDVGILLSEMGVCKLSNVDMLPAARRQNSVKLQWLNPILPSDSEYCNLRMVACDTTICDFEVSTIAMHSMNYDSTFVTHYHTFYRVFLYAQGQ